MNQSTYPWRYRRVVVFVTLLVCFAGIAWLTLRGADTRLNETLALGFFALAGSTIGSYVFGAVWHDTSLMARPRRRGPVDPREMEVDSAPEEGGSE
jgi:heme/copper-type cytochrome/quinol oxidase subunit 1